MLVSILFMCFFIMECNVDQSMCMRAPGSKTNFPIGDNKKKCIVSIPTLVLVLDRY